MRRISMSLIPFNLRFSLLYLCVSLLAAIKMSRNPKTLILFIGIAFLGLIQIMTHAMAHHSFAAEFSYELFGAREGEVVEVLFVNPHAHIFFTVKNEAGEEEMWDAQSSAPQNLLRRGWGPDTIKVGDRIVVEGNLGLENSNKLWIITITQENGEVIYASGGDN